MVPRVEPPPPVRQPTIPNSKVGESSNIDKPIIFQPRPLIPRRVTEPTSESSLPQMPPVESLPLRPRNRSPFSRSHLRSRSSASSFAAQSMMRSHSMPTVDTGSRILMSTTRRPASPLGSQGRYRSPSRRYQEDTTHAFGGQGLLDVGESISEIPELDRMNEHGARLDTLYNPLPLPPTSNNSFPRRRRPSSPLQQLSRSPILGSVTQPTPTSANSSPLIGPTKFSEPFPTSIYFPQSFSSASSLPSTPTSVRSRSPSISSLETIPDSPGAEEAAVAAEQIAQLKAIAESTEEGNNVVDTIGPRCRGSSDCSGAGRIGFGSTGGGSSLGVTYGSRDKRKRWSVCGAERRSDLDLETIWED
ncbi:MAG: hypothetical protein M1827_004087 [Pycnora praestabilis]|nr:MAG: hypothetical protein M1827_004087 [Pycnora praestabilis]